MLQLAGALLGMCLFTRLGLWLFRKWELTPGRIIVSHAVVYVLAAIAYAYGAADGGEPKVAHGFLLYLVPTLLIISFDIFRLARPSKKALERPVASWKMWMIPAVAFAGAYIAFHALGREGRDWIDRLTTTDADIRSDLEKRFGTSKTYQALKQHYPEAYDQLLNSGIRDVRNGTSDQQAPNEGAEFTANLRRKNAQYLGMASVETLRMQLRSLPPLYRYLKTAYGYKVCNEMAVNGGFAILNMLGPKWLKDETLHQLFDESGGSFFQAAAEGRRLAIKHEQPTDLDWRAAGDYLISRGMAENKLQMLTNAAEYKADPGLCDALIEFYEGITTMDNGAGQRIIPLLAADAAAG